MSNISASDLPVLLTTVIKHLPGRHSQLSHGKKGDESSSEPKYGSLSRAYLEKGKDIFNKTAQALGVTDLSDDDSLNRVMSALKFGDGKIRTQPVDLDKNTVKAIRPAQLWLAQTVSRTRPGATEVVLAHSSTGGSYHDDEANKDVIFISEEPSEIPYADKNVVHEYAHWFSTDSPVLIRASADFLKARATGILKKEPNGDVTWADKFISSYLGKEYRGTDKGPVKTNEILSGGLENFYARPKTFYRYDRDTFYFVLGAIGHV